MSRHSDNTYVISLIFGDGSQMKYVIKKRNFYEAKNEANDVKSSWNESNNPKIKDFSIKEIRNEDNKKQKGFNNPRHSSKSKVRKEDSDEE